MSGKKDKAGKTIGERIAERAHKRSHLRSQSMPGGEVFRGSLADEALSKVGARAMTIDGEIVVNSSFDSTKSEDQALYAHERLHQEESGGAAGAMIRDAEEIKARMVEAMVFHKASQGDSSILTKSSDELLAEYEKESGPGGSSSGGGAQPVKSNASGSEDQTPSAVEGYLSLLDEGYSHEEVVQRLARKILDEMELRQGRDRNRTGAYRGFIK